METTADVKIMGGNQSKEEAERPIPSDSSIEKQILLGKDENDEFTAEKDTMCFLCGKSFRTVLALQNHVEISHATMTEEQRQQCLAKLMNNPFLRENNSNRIIDSQNTELFTETKKNENKDIDESLPDKDMMDEITEEISENKDHHVLEDYINGRSEKGKMNLHEINQSYIHQEEAHEDISPIEKLKNFAELHNYFKQYTSSDGEIVSSGSSSILATRQSGSTPISPSESPSVISFGSELPEIGSSATTNPMDAIQMQSNEIHMKKDIDVNLPIESNQPFAAHSASKPMYSPPIPQMTTPIDSRVASEYFHPIIPERSGHSRHVAAERKLIKHQQLSQNQKISKTVNNDDQRKVLSAIYDFTEDRCLETSSKSGVPLSFKTWFQNPLLKNRQRIKDSDFNLNNPSFSYKEYLKTDEVKKTRINTIGNSGKQNGQQKRQKITNDLFESSKKEPPPKHEEFPDMCAGDVKKELLLIKESPNLEASVKMDMHRPLFPLMMPPPTMHPLMASASGHHMMPKAAFDTNFFVAQMFQQQQLFQQQKRATLMSLSAATPPSVFTLGSQVPEIGSWAGIGRVDRMDATQRLIAKDVNMELINESHNVQASSSMNMYPSMIPLLPPPPMDSQMTSACCPESCPSCAPMMGNFSGHQQVIHKCPLWTGFYEKQCRHVGHLEIDHVYKSLKGDINNAGYSNPENFQSPPIKKVVLSNFPVTDNKMNISKKEDLSRKHLDGTYRCNILSPRIEPWREHQVVHTMNPTLLPSDQPLHFPVLQYDSPTTDSLHLSQMKHNIYNDEESQREHSRDKTPRNTILPEQLDCLYQQYQIKSNPSKQIVEKIATKVGLNERDIQMWFQNTRARKGNFPGQQQAVHKCPFCAALYEKRCYLVRHMEINHAYESLKGDMHISNAGYSNPEEEFESPSIKKVVRSNFQVTANQMNNTPNEARKHLDERLSAVTSSKSGKEQQHSTDFTMGKILDTPPLHKTLLLVSPTKKSPLDLNKNLKEEIVTIQVFLDDGTSRETVIDDALSKTYCESADNVDGEVINVTIASSR